MSDEDNEEVVQLEENEISLLQNKDDRENVNSHMSQPKYAKRKESINGLNWVGAKISQKLELKETDEQMKHVL